MAARTFAEPPPGHPGSVARCIYWSPTPSERCTLRYLYLAAALLVPLVLAEAQQNVSGTIAVPVVARVATDPLGRDNPQSTVISFLQACRIQDYRQASAYLDLHALPAAQKGDEGPTVARQLELLLDRNMKFDAGSLSRNPEGDTGAGGRETRCHLL